MTAEYDLLEKVFEAWEVVPREQSYKVICLCYCDDCLFFAKDKTEIDRVIEDLKNPTDPKHQKMFLEVEADAAGFLGIELKKLDDGTIELLQTGLIDRIINVTGMNDCAGKSTPAEKMPLGKDLEGEPCQESWSYPSVIGMLMYLSTNSRGEIAYAVHSCARFTHNPKKIHEKAVKRIVRYLKQTRERGMIVQPCENLQLNMYCDADFAGLYQVEDKDDPISVKSRSDMVITLGNIGVRSYRLKWH